MSNYDFFQNRECEYFPCHKTEKPEAFSCLFCYCPLYALGRNCGGNYSYTEGSIKDCSRCLRPHSRENYAAICDDLRNLIKFVGMDRKHTELGTMLRYRIPALRIEYNRPLAFHTSLRIGGPAAIMVFPNSPEQLAEIVKICYKMDIKPAILGAGTNILAPDKGVDRLVICLKDGLGTMEQVDDTHVRFMAGVTMTRAAVFAAAKGLSGLEFAHGIPGTIGGGVYMNAGAYGGEIGNVCKAVRILSEDGSVKTVSAEELSFCYRHSALEENGGVVVEAVFELRKGNTEDIRAKMRELQKKRSASQPLDLPSAGSAFKRPANGYAAALIDQSGLKGYRVGNAAISEKHAGFAVNLGGATSEDFCCLLNDVSQRVYENTGIHLEPEIRIW